ncbi:hypothetical protein SAMN04489726_2148 [Allokutzneria albata]|uniref:Uncharacterized protein n=1 Tax=Allokutzneria albata TaxID=211114 RepID=A0A1G9U318_ALLAB|nr:hypothetical protein SAMN04489726_2148 [Allokutzneria albata]
MSSIGRAWGSSASEAGVGTMPLGVRVNSDAPRSFSGAMIGWLSDDARIPKRSAALVRCASSTTAHSYRNRRSSIAPSYER